MASNERLSTSSELFSNIACDVCSMSGKYMEAKKRCFDCKQALCTVCLIEHEFSGVPKGHRVVDLDATIVGPIPSQMSNSHEEELFDLQINHRRSDGIDYGIKASLQLFGTQLMLGKLELSKNRRGRDKIRLADETKQSERNVQESVENIITMLNSLKEKSLHQIRQQNAISNKQINDDLQKIGDVVSSLEDDVKVLQSPLNNDAQLCAALKQNKDNQERGVNLNSKINLFREAIHFNVDHQIEEIIEQVNSLGELETPLLKTPQSIEWYKYVQVMGDYNKCSIADICAMPNGTTLVSDYKNRKLKLLDSSVNVVDHCKLPGSPYGICRTGPTEVAVTLKVAQKVQFVSVTSTLTPTRSFCIGETCRGIAFSRGQLFITCGGSIDVKKVPGEVRVYTTDGKLLHKLPQMPTNQILWSVPKEVAVSPDGSKVIVSDGKRLVTIDRDGSNVIKTPLAGATSLCVQDQSLWFACDSTHKRIFRFSDDGSNLGTLTEESGIEPRSVCYHRDGSRLIVGFRNYNFIKVFQLQRN